MAIGRTVFSREVLSNSCHWKFFKSSIHWLYMLCHSRFIITEPILTDNMKVRMLNQVLLARLAITALARLARNTKARNKATNRPMPGIIPAKTPRPAPRAIFWGVSFIINNLRWSVLINFDIYIIKIKYCVLCLHRLISPGHGILASSRYKDDIFALCFGLLHIPGYLSGDLSWGAYRPYNKGYIGSLS